jgi:hypothetical protein
MPRALFLNTEGESVVLLGGVLVIYSFRPAHQLAWQSLSLAIAGVTERCGFEPPAGAMRPVQGQKSERIYGALL